VTAFDSQCLWLSLDPAASVKQVSVCGNACVCVIDRCWAVWSWAACPSTVVQDVSSCSVWRRSELSPSTGWTSAMSASFSSHASMTRWMHTEDLRRPTVMALLVSSYLSTLALPVPAQTWTTPSPNSSQNFLSIFWHPFFLLVVVILKNNLLSPLDSSKLISIVPFT